METYHIRQNKRDWNHNHWRRWIRIFVRNTFCIEIRVEKNKMHAWLSVASTSANFSLNFVLHDTSSILHMYVSFCNFMRFYFCTLQCSQLNVCPTALLNRLLLDYFKKQCMISCGCTSHYSFSLYEVYWMNRKISYIDFSLCFSLLNNSTFIIRLIRSIIENSAIVLMSYVMVCDFHIGRSLQNIL